LTPSPKKRLKLPTSKPKAKRT